MSRNNPCLLGSVLLMVLFLPASLNAQVLFQAVQRYDSGGQNAVAVAVADLNGDGKPDIAVANGCTVCTSDGVFGVGVLLGNGDGTFQAAQNYALPGLGPSSVAIGDVNGDGKPDLLAVTGCFSNSNCANGGIWVLFGNGDGTFQPGLAYSSGGINARGIAVADVNGDGKLDLLVTNCGDINSSGICSYPSLEDGNVAVLLGNGDGSFQPALSYQSGGTSAWSLAVGDVNLDGKIDVTVFNCSPEGVDCDRTPAHSVVGVLLGNGDGTFQPALAIDSGGVDASGIALADVNGDSNSDLVVTNNSAVAVLLGSGGGTFQSAQIYKSGGSGANAVAVADVNRDGKPDLLVDNAFCGNSYNCSHGAVGVFLGNGDGTFQPPTRNNSGGDEADGIVVADVNGDSKPDLIVANAFRDGFDISSGVIGVLLGTARWASTTSLSSSRNNSLYGQAITLTANVKSAGGITPTGAIEFQNNGKWIGAGVLSGGLATLTKPHLPAGALSLTAIYSGDTQSLRSVSAPLIQTIRPATTRTMLTSSLNPSAQGQAVTFTVQVTSSTAQVTGTVTFTAGTTVLGTLTLTLKGKASVTTSALPKGSAEITAAYNGTANISKSSGSLTQIVN